MGDRNKTQEQNFRLAKKSAPSNLNKDIIFDTPSSSDFMKNYAKNQNNDYQNKNNNNQNSSQNFQSESLATLLKQNNQQSVNSINNQNDTKLSQNQNQKQKQSFDNFALNLKVQNNQNSSSSNGSRFVNKLQPNKNININFPQNKLLQNGNRFMGTQNEPILINNSTFTEFINQNPQKKDVIKEFGLFSDKGNDELNSKKNVNDIWNNGEKQIQNSLVAYNLTKTLQQKEEIKKREIELKQKHENRLKETKEIQEIKIVKKKQQTTLDNFFEQKGSTNNNSVEQILKQAQRQEKKANILPSYSLTPSNNFFKELNQKNQLKNKAFNFNEKDQNYQKQFQQKLLDQKKQQNQTGKSILDKIAEKELRMQMRYDKNNRKLKKIEEENRRKKQESIDAGMRELKRDLEMRELAKRKKERREQQNRRGFADMMSKSKSNKQEFSQLIDNSLKIKKKKHVEQQNQENQNENEKIGTDVKKQHVSFYEKEIKQNQYEDKQDFNNLEDFEIDETNDVTPLIRQLLQKDYRNDSVLNQESKQIPDNFPSYEEYTLIFRYLFVNECVSILYNILQQFKKSTSFSLGQPVSINLINAQRTNEGYTEFRILQGHKKEGEEYKKRLKNYKPKRRIADIFDLENEGPDLEDGELEWDMEQENQQYEFDLTLQKNYLMLVCSEQDPDLTKISNTEFTPKDENQQFCFLGLLVPPTSQKDVRILLKTEVNGFKYSFKFDQQYQNAYIYPVEKVTSFMREYLAIQNLGKNVDLTKQILKPNLIMEDRYRHIIRYPKILQSFIEMTQSRYNETQCQIIREVCLIEKGICVVQGPPGTGKTHTLLGLVSGLNYYQQHAPRNGSKKKIMICAPSNTAINEVIERIQVNGLISIDGQKQNINIVRIGILDSNASESVRETCLEYQSQQQLNKIMNKQGKHTATELRQLISEINDKISKLGKIRSKDRKVEQENLLKIDQLQNERKRRYQQLNEVKQIKIAQKSRLKQIINEILMTADIICCTLSSSASDKLDIFRNEIGVLIIDEAAQATEPNALIPLQFCPQKVVLIGDPKQLPATTFSQDSHVTKYNRSLLERVVDNSVQPYFLDIQYRMHPDIRQFPSNMFYNDKLKDAEVIYQREYPEFLKSIQQKNLYFIDLLISRQSVVDKSYQNETEAEVIIQFVEYFVEQIRKYGSNVSNTIGIISPYKQQVKLLKKYMREKIQNPEIRKMAQKHIFINTVDSFQGQEKDLIIFSSVRAVAHVNTNSKRENLIGFLSDERRLNVALTRAKHGLLVFGNSNTLSSDETWSQLIDFMSDCNRYVKVENKYQQEDFVHKFTRGKVAEAQTKYAKLVWEKKKKKKTKVLNINDFQNDVASDENQQEESSDESSSESVKCQTVVLDKENNKDKPIKIEDSENKFNQEKGLSFNHSFFQDTNDIDLEEEKQHQNKEKKIQNNMQNLYNKNDYNYIENQSDNPLLALLGGSNNKKQSEQNIIDLDFEFNGKNNKKKQKIEAQFSDSEDDQQQQNQKGFKLKKVKNQKEDINFNSLKKLELEDAIKINQVQQRIQEEKQQMCSGDLASLLK
ncbi:P-loop containing nucleoside triphosphate hydrolase [Pseudocohnilembus persalinus]|uniref:p-loop containing nucleoside triphosphate hydrolase n=1 Tax=Pseudocohnilembus persalinus TaxID=266149 RepID=A0A0V0QVP7_PSEPJ|nr:P-loop containing nucleoside triphosphate hydrolase [Pseudocohnilembus persalinus]|eukprot:KRX05957.1 P-loop containing nucleoside triphosphate hydrolase [Pseudocohnilembus persalinus]